MKRVAPRLVNFFFKFNYDLHLKTSRFLCSPPTLCPTTQNEWWMIHSFTCSCMTSSYRSIVCMIFLFLTIFDLVPRYHHCMHSIHVHVVIAFPWSEEKCWCQTFCKVRDASSCFLIRIDCGITRKHTLFKPVNASDATRAKCMYRLLDPEYDGYFGCCFSNTLPFALIPDAFTCDSICGICVPSSVRF